MKIEEAVWSEPERLGGTLCFRGTRIPVATLFDHLDADEMDAFREDFPDVTPAMISAVLSASREFIERSFRERAA